MSERSQNPLRRVGAMWKPKPGAKSLGSGSLTINGLRQRFVVLRNDRKAKDTDPDYVLMAGDEPTADTYIPRQSTASPSPRSTRAATADPF